MVESGFAAAHQLKEYEGKCEGLHGHNWRVQLLVKTDHLNHIGLGIDFKILKRILNEILSRLDHAFLNDIEPFQTQNPSSENLACYIYGEFLKKLQVKSVQLDWVRVWESTTAYAQYSQVE